MVTKAEKAEESSDEAPLHRSCATSEVNERLLRNVEGYAESRAEIENRTARVLDAQVALRTGCTEIPVVVHVVYRNATENVSNAQIDSQITALNADFRATNADKASTPTVFQGLIGDARVTFKLATTDPDGNPTDGITRTSTTTTPFNSDTDNVKSAATGGSDAWPSDRYLNLWVCGNLRSGSGQSLLGYAQFPGGPTATDGVVVIHSGFGTTGTAAAPFNLGRTTTHEIGHWLNLRHIWGDDGTGCSGSDFVVDTPNQGGPNYGTPTFPSSSCSNGPNGDLFMNYMDYTDDAAMFMFTVGQVDRMQAALDGPRSSIGVSGPCGGKPVKEFAKDLPKDGIKDLPKDGFKDFPKDGVKDLPKDGVKDFPKDGVKDKPKDGVKDKPKDGVKDFPKDRPKDLIKDNPKDFVKDNPKDLVKDKPKDGVKDFPKDRPKDLIKDRPKDLSKDGPKDLGKDMMKDFAKDPMKDPRKEGVKDLPKDAIKDTPKDGIKDFADDVPKQLRDPVKELGGEIGPIDPGPLIDPVIGGGFGGGPFGGGATPFVIGGRDETEYGAGQPAEVSPLAVIAEQLEGILADYGNAAAAGQLSASDVARWQQLVGVYAQIIALLG